MPRRVAALALALAFPVAALAAARSSTNYQIVSDSLNAGGGLSSSASYEIEDTVGEAGVGTSSSASYQVSAGYQREITGGSLSISSPSNVTLPSVSGLTGGDSSSSVSWTVTSSGGYQLSARAGTAPALLGPGGAKFDDYQTGTPDFIFAYGTGDAVFGYSPEGSHVVARFKDNGSACATGSGETSDRCFVGFTTSDVAVASSGSGTGGTATALRLRAGIGSARIQDSGSYSATITVTAVAL